MNSSSVPRRSIRWQPERIFPHSEAEREIASDCIERLQQFLAGERSFDDAMTVEEYVVPVTAFPDGSITDEDGAIFPNPQW